MPILSTSVPLSEGTGKKQGHVAMPRPAARRRRVSTMSPREPSRVSLLPENAARGYGRRMTVCHLHLISDSTGETASTVARAALAQFDAVEAIEHSWALVRTRDRLERALSSVRRNPGVVLYTLVEPTLRSALEERCRDLGVVCVDVLGEVMAKFTHAFGVESVHAPGRQHLLDGEYYRRIDAMQFVLAHDDGQAPEDLAGADVIVVGVSRVSKSPTCMYLANRGVKAANVPFVSGARFPEGEIADAGPPVVGLTASADRLVELRRNRLHGLGERGPSAYADLPAVRDEVAEARRTFARHGWPVIDVSRRSIEETAAAILELHRDRLGAE